MFRKFLIPLLAAILLAAPAAFGPATPPGFSGRAQAAATSTSSRSNTQHNPTISPLTQLLPLLTQFPGGGPGLRAAVAWAVEADPSLADVFVLLAKKANRAQKLAIGMGLADAADYFAKCGLDSCRGAESLIRTAMIDADPDTRVGFTLGSAPTLVQGIPGFNNAGATANGCGSSNVISPSGPGRSGTPSC
jgi:hypothetical protein